MDKICIPYLILIWCFSPAYQEFGKNHYDIEDGENGPEGCIGPTFLSGTFDWKMYRCVANGGPLRESDQIAHVTMFGSVLGIIWYQKFSQRLHTRWEISTFWNAQIWKNCHFFVAFSISPVSTESSDPMMRLDRVHSCMFRIEKWNVSV
jgi:hypothetical protein